MREFYGGTDKEEISQEFVKWKQDFCEIGTKCILRMHHKVQLSHGGKDSISNVITLCEKCESRILHDSIKAFGEDSNGKEQAHIQKANDK
jgi:5-methylcytosine-specific restriction endonuclease McrA